MRNLACHWLTGHALGAKQGEVSGQRWCSCQGDELCLLSGLWSQGLSLSLSHEGLQFLKPGRVVPKVIGQNTWVPPTPPLPNVMSPGDAHTAAAFGESCGFSLQLAVQATCPAHTWLNNQSFHVTASFILLLFPVGKVGSLSAEGVPAEFGTGVRLPKARGPAEAL